MKRWTLVLLGPGVAAACGGTAASGGGAPTDSGSVDASAPETSVDAGPNPCAHVSIPPATLECAGLYSDFATKTLAPNARTYTPAVPLWSDGATKKRWIELPPGTTIDRSDPNEWTFPPGTKVFKEFTYEGKRVETRLWQKTSTGFWVHTTYKWNADDSATTQSYGETVTLPDGDTWNIPSPSDCEACHFGRTDRILGFDEVSLGQSAAEGLTLAHLASEDLLRPPPPRTSLSIGSDGTGLDGPALAWLHVNCGVTCHNANEGAQAYGAGMRLRLDPAWLDGSPANPAAWDPLRTALGVACTSGSVAGQPRIEPGDPSGSVLVQLISNRGGLQMPPAPLSRFVDTPDVAAVSAWIAAMPPEADDAGGGDAGAGDAAEGDASTGDASASDASGGEASTNEASAGEASTGDAAAGDAAEGGASTGDAGASD
jgi:hypothetical protein